MTDVEDHPDPPPGRSLEQSVEVPGSPEDVWQAIATGPGISSWFVPTTVEQWPGGEAAMDYGADFGVETADVEVWDEPRRVVFRTRGDRPLAFEWTVEASSGDTCVVRLVSSGFGNEADWDEQYHGMELGWGLFLESLRLHATHFPGLRAQPVVVTVLDSGPNANAWKRLRDALAVTGGLAVGDVVSSGPGAPTLSATVESAQEAEAISATHLLLDHPASGTGFLAVEGGGDQVAVSVYLYLYGLAESEAADLASTWRAWLGEHVAKSP